MFSGLHYSVLFLVRPDGLGALRMFNELFHWLNCFSNSDCPSSTLNRILMVLFALFLAFHNRHHHHCLGCLFLLNPVKTFLQDLTRKGPFLASLQDLVRSCEILLDIAGILHKIPARFLQDPTRYRKIPQDLARKKDLFL